MGGLEEVLRAIDALVDRQRDGEDGALRAVLGEADLSVVHINQRLGQVKADADAIGGEGALHEPLEQLRLLLTGDADARVLNDDLKQVAHLDPHCDTPFLWGVFEGIRQQVVDHLVDVLVVNEHRERLHRRQEGVVHLFVLGYVSEVQVDVSYKGNDVSLLELQAELVVLHLAEREQLVDEAHHAVGAFLYGADGLS